MNDASGTMAAPPLGCAAVMMGVLHAGLRERNLPVTHQREMVAQVLFESPDCLSVEDIATRFRERGEHIGKATVYRTLRLLVDMKLATEHDFDEGFKRYETSAGTPNHYHLICTTCGRVTDFRDATLDRLQNAVAEARGFEALTRQLKIYGVCAECRRSSNLSFLRRPTP